MLLDVDSFNVFVWLHVARVAADNAMESPVLFGFLKRTTQVINAICFFAKPGPLFPCIFTSLPIYQGYQRHIHRQRSTEKQKKWLPTTGNCKGRCTD